MSAHNVLSSTVKRLLTTLGVATKVVGRGDDMPTTTRFDESILGRTAEDMDAGERAEARTEDINRALDLLWEIGRAYGGNSIDMQRARHCLRRESLRSAAIVALGVAS